jgi:hypothetical protein
LAGLALQQLLPPDPSSPRPQQHDDPTVPPQRTNGSHESGAVLSAALGALAVLAVDTQARPRILAVPRAAAMLARAAELPDLRPGWPEHSGGGRAGSEAAEGGAHGEADPAASGCCAAAAAEPVTSGPRAAAEPAATDASATGATQGLCTVEPRDVMTHEPPAGDDALLDAFLMAHDQPTNQVGCPAFAPLVTVA